MILFKSVTFASIFLFPLAYSAPAGGEDLQTEWRIRDFHELVERPPTLPGPNERASSSNLKLSSSLSLTDAEAMALTSHPRIAESTARVRAARFHCLQVGLPPNPTAGYVATEMGNEGAAGQQGMYVGQRFVRGKKLELNRAVACREIRQREQELAAEQLRVLTKVRTTFYEVYLAQREVELTTQLVNVSDQATKSVERLLLAKEARRTDLLQAEIENQRITARLAQATATFHSTWRKLAAEIGQPNRAWQRVVAVPEDLLWPYDWAESRRNLLASSPLVASAIVEVSRAQAVWRRACAEPIPDLNTQLSVQYDDATQDTVTSLQVGMRLPLWNRNQGAIGRARQEVVAAKRRLEVVELNLSQSLAETLQQYESAQAKAETYRDKILMRAEENLGLVKEAFAAGEASFLDLLTVQRTYFESNLDYLNALRAVNRSVRLLEGLMLVIDTP